MTANSNQKTFGSPYQKGQVAVEYILLVAISVTLATLLVSALVSRNPQSPGIITNKWRQILEMIATDKIETLNPNP